jgi:hypothetical protein
MGTFTPHSGTHCFISNNTPMSWESSPNKGKKHSISVLKRNNTPISWENPTYRLSHRSTHSVCVLEDVSRSYNHQHEELLPTTFSKMDEIVGDLSEMNNPFRVGVMTM